MQIEIASRTVVHHLSGSDLSGQKKRTDEVVLDIFSFIFLLLWKVIKHSNVKFPQFR